MGLPGVGRSLRLCVHGTGAEEPSHHPALVALVVGLVFAGGASLSSLEQVVETWTSVYYIAGTVSLFAHVMSRSTASRTLFITGGSGLETRDSRQA